MTETEAAPANKTEFLARMREGRTAWDALIAAVPDEVKNETSLPNGWSVKDLIAHVAAYEQWTVEQITGGSGDAQSSEPDASGDEGPANGGQSWDTDSINAMIYDQHKDADLASVKTFAEQSLRALIEAVEATSDEELGKPATWTGGKTILALLPVQTYAHLEQHVADLRTVAGKGAG